MIMALSATVVQAASVVAAIGTIGGGFVIVESRYAPISVMGDLAVMQLFDLVDQAQKSGPAPWICEAIDKEIIRLCSQQSEHYLCGDDGKEARQDIKRRAGCE